MESVFSDIMVGLEKNRPLSKLLWLTFFAGSELAEFPEITEQLVGDWDDAMWGDKVLITFSDPYRIERGYLLTLPNLEGDFIDRAIVHIPRLSTDTDESIYYTLKHLATIADTIELEILL